MNVFERSEWIWLKESENNYENYENRHVEFLEELDYEGGRTLLRLSVCNDYTLFINGRYVASNQYADFPHYKVYDEIDITGDLIKGKNRIVFLVWYFGKSGMRYYSPLPGLVYEIICDGETVAFSSESTLSRKNAEYSDAGKKITGQLGYGFTYDATKRGTALDFSASENLREKPNFYPRPTGKLSLGAPHFGRITETEDGYLIDLGEELVGLLSFSLFSEGESKINISYGELLEDGHVKRIIGNRDFSVRYIAAAGENEFTDHMLRLACRYLEVKCDRSVKLHSIGIIPQYYEVKPGDYRPSSELDARIYDICLNTLRLCMMEHYVDCPWREQCLYAFDSRNQILAGYYAFEGGNVDYARANLSLIGRDNREDELLAICFPSNDDLTIPSFSLYYILAVKEYVEYSGDVTLAEEVIDKLERILRTFADRIDSGLARKFVGANRWNFYDWSPYAYDEIGCSEEGSDILLNAIFVIALGAYDKLCARLGRKNSFEGVAESVCDAAVKKYYDEKNHLFFINDPSEGFTELANSLAVLSGMATGDIAAKICEKLAENELVPCSLSMKTFKYDAMLGIDRDRYRGAVLAEIREQYGRMLDSGSTTVWETAEGAKAFDNAGSLCHGWSALPIYYYRMLDEK